MSLNLFSTGWHVIGATLVFLLGAWLAIGMARVFDTTRRRSLLLYGWHTVFCLVYIAYVARSGGDALGYYTNSLAGAGAFSFGTAAINALTAFFSEVLGLSLLGTFLAFNIMGFVGLVAFDASLQRAVSGARRRIRGFATAIILLPSVSFWSSAIGKDAISFMSAGFALWASRDLRNRLWLMLLAIVLMLVVRPHMAALMATAFAFALLYQPDIGLLRRLGLAAFAAAGCATLIPLALQTAGLGIYTGLFELNDYVEERQQQNLEGGGGIEISKMTLPMRLITYLVRPLPFEAHSFPAFAASLDNMVLLFLVLAGFLRLFRRVPWTDPANRVFLWFYVLSAWLILSSTTANLGISVRQKWMFVPMLVYLLLSPMGRGARAMDARGHAGGLRRDGR